MVLGPPQSHGIFPWGFKVPTGALRAGEGLTLPVGGAVCPLHRGGRSLPPRALPRLSPDPLERPEPQASSPQDTCWVLPAPRTQAWTQVWGGGHPSVSRGTSPGLGAHLLLDPRLVDATERGRMHVSPGASRLQVGMTFQAEYQPQGEKRDGQKGSWASPWGNPPPMLAALISP